MGSPVSPIIANLYMERFEQRALESFPGLTPRVWLRFVDDTFVVVDKKDQTPFFDHIKSCDENIKFTQEEAQDNTLASLDTAIHREHNGPLSTKVCTASPHTPIITDSSAHINPPLPPFLHKLTLTLTQSE